jgi:hypothetical protein
LLLGLLWVFGFCIVLNFLHGNLKSNNTVCDEDHRIKIITIGDMYLEVQEGEFVTGSVVCEFSEERRNVQTDVSGFVALLFEITVDQSGDSQVCLRND